MSIENENGNFAKPVLGVVPSTKALSIVGSSRNNGEREAEDFYPTPPYAVEELLKREVFSGNIWECACGEGDISEVFKNKGFEVISTDLINRGYGEQLDFLQSDLVADNIVTNPPYSDYNRFLEHSFALADNIVLLVPVAKMFKSLGTLKLIFEYGGFVSIHTLPASKAGFPFGFPCAVYYLKRGYKGETKIEMLQCMDNVQSELFGSSCS